MEVIMAYKYSYDEEKQYQPPKLPTNRSMLKLMILNILTLGIYSIIFFMPISLDLDKVDPPREQGRTMSFLTAYILSLFTFSIVSSVWYYLIAGRIEDALSHRDIDYNFGKGDFWKWYILGSLIFVGPFIYFHKLCKAMNLLCENYNEKNSLH